MREPLFQVPNKNYIPLGVRIKMCKRPVFNYCFRQTDIVFS